MAVRETPTTPKQIYCALASAEAIEEMSLAITHEESRRMLDETIPDAQTIARAILMLVGKVREVCTAIDWALPAGKRKTNSSNFSRTAVTYRDSARTDCYKLSSPA